MASEIIFLTLPIGNLADITVRVSQALQEGKKFVVEDSRVFLSLMNALKFSTEGKEWVVWHDHSSQNELSKIKYWLKEGLKIYVVSDAGSPVLSDPAYGLLESLKNLALSFKLDSFPGATSVVHALELSQLPPIPFHFHGFLARNDTDYKKQVEKNSSVVGTHIYFISPHRLIETVDDIIEIIPEAKFCLARELTKMFQEVISFENSKWQQIKENLIIKGEFVLLFYIAQTENKVFDLTKIKQLASDYLEKPKTKLLAKLLSEINGEDVSKIYDQISKDKN